MWVVKKGKLLFQSKHCAVLAGPAKKEMKIRPLVISGPPPV